MGTILSSIFLYLISMTFIHFLDCSALAFLPSVVIYRATQLSEYGQYSTLIYSGAGYVIFQLIQMLLLATFVPLYDLDEFNVLHEGIKAFFLLTDLVGIRYLLLQVSGHADLRILAVGVGWGTAQSFLGKFLTFLFNARGPEFTWTYLLMAMTANFDLFASICKAALVWIWTRKDQTFVSNTVVKIALFSTLIFPSILTYIEKSLQLSEFEIFLSRAGYTVAIALLTFVARSTAATKKKSY